MLRLRDFWLFKMWLEFGTLTEDNVVTVTGVELAVSGLLLSSSSKGEFSKWKNIENLFCQPGRSKMRWLS